MVEIYVCSILRCTYAKAVCAAVKHHFNTKTNQRKKEETWIPYPSGSIWRWRSELKWSSTHSESSMVGSSTSSSGFEDCQRLLKRPPPPLKTKFRNGHEICFSDIQEKALKFVFSFQRIELSNSRQSHFRLASSLLVWYIKPYFTN